MEGLYQIGHKLPHELLSEQYYVYNLTQHDFEMLWNENIISLMNHAANATIDDFKDTVIMDHSLMGKIAEDLNVLESIVNQSLKLVIQKIVFLLKQALERNTLIIFNF